MRCNASKRWSGICLMAFISVHLLAGTLPAGDGHTPSILSMFQKRKPVENSTVLRAENGPWLILAATLSGPNAQQQASDLAVEVEERLRVPAYVLEKTFDTTGRLGSTTQMVRELDGSTTQYQKWTEYANGSKERIFAVLVGEFTSTTDPRIEKILNSVRTMKPVSLAKDGEQVASKPGEEESGNWLVKKYRSMIWSRTDRDSNQSKGPMGAAFVTRNPLLPDDFFQAPKIDDFVLKLNKQVEHSLLECPSRFTVRVASFYGYANTQLVSGKSGQEAASNALDRAAEKANKLTLALRKKGVEAYQFHDRVGSYVTVGSFNKLGKQLSNASFQYDPAILKIIKDYCGYRTVTARDPTTGAVVTKQSLNSLERIPFDVDGKPMAVPKRETSRLYRNSLLGGK